MNFNSVSYMVFLPVAAIGWFLIPEKFKNIYLLAVSYYFYLCNEVRFFLLLPVLTAVTWGAGVMMEKAKNKKPFSSLPFLPIWVHWYFSNTTAFSWGQ